MLDYVGFPVRNQDEFWVQYVFYFMSDTPVWLFIGARHLSFGLLMISMESKDYIIDSYFSFVITNLHTL